MYRQYNCSTVYVTYSLTYGKIDSNLAKIALNWSSSPDVFTDNIPTFSEYNNNVTAFFVSTDNIPRSPSTNSAVDEYTNNILTYQFRSM